MLIDGDVDQAIQLFTESLEIYPTAEAFTFRGWAYSFEGRLDDAIRECRMAIATDADFGNPYNDLGVYLIAKGDFLEAIDWFEKAKIARRYEPRHYPYLNLGRLYAMRGMNDLAAVEFERALELNPEDYVAAAFLDRHPLRPN